MNLVQQFEKGGHHLHQVARGDGATRLRLGLKISRYFEIAATAAQQLDVHLRDDAETLALQVDSAGLFGRPDAGTVDVIHEYPKGHHVEQLVDERERHAAQSASLPIERNGKHQVRTVTKLQHQIDQASLNVIIAGDHHEFWASRRRNPGSDSRAEAEI